MNAPFSPINAFKRGLKRAYRFQLHLSSHPPPSMLYLTWIFLPILFCLSHSIKQPGTGSNVRLRYRLHLMGCCVFVVDVDECAASSRVCHAKASCTNMPGFYRCTCKPGYSCNGKMCKGEIKHNHLQVKI